MQDINFVVKGITIEGQEGYIVGEFTRYGSGGYYLHLEPHLGIFMGHTPSQKGRDSKVIPCDKIFQALPKIKLEGKWRKEISKIIRQHL